MSADWSSDLAMAIRPESPEASTVTSSRCSRGSRGGGLGFASTSGRSQSEQRENPATYSAPHLGQNTVLIPAGGHGVVGYAVPLETLTISVGLFREPLAVWEFAHVMRPDAGK